jgi:hypothetical protein
MASLPLPFLKQLQRNPRQFQESLHLMTGLHPQRLRTLPVLRHVLSIKAAPVHQECPKLQTLQKLV